MVVKQIRDGLSVPIRTLTTLRSYPPLETLSATRPDTGQPGATNAQAVGSHTIQVRNEDAKGHRERAGQNGAVILTEPQDQPYGERHITLRIFTAADGTSPKPSPMSLLRNGAAVHFIWNELGVTYL